MRPDAVARRYARALFELAREQSELDRVQAALAAVARLLDDPALARALTGPITGSRRIAWLREIADQTGAPAAFASFLQLLEERDRLRHLPAIRTVFDALVDERNGVTRAAVRSADALADAVVAQIADTFSGITGKTVKVEVEVAPELIAGIIVEVDGRVYDGSLRTQLAKLHRQMAAG
jgi:F-type H+-transporting ATPase subunit delta